MSNTQFKYPCFVALISENHILVTDTDHRKGSGQGQFDEPWGVACDSSGAVYAADSYNEDVQKFSADGQFISSFGSKESQESALLPKRHLH